MASSQRPELVTEHDDLYRTLHHQFVTDGIVSASAFYTNNQADPISVYVKRLAPPPEELPKLIEKPHLGVGVLPARVPIVELGLTVLHAPEPDAYSHAHILNPGDKGRQREMCRRMAAAMTVLIGPRTPR